MTKKNTQKVEGITEAERFDHHKQSALLFQSLKDALQIHRPDSHKVQRLTRECIAMLADILGEEGLLSDPAALEINPEKLDDSVFPAASPFSGKQEQLLGKAFQYYYEAQGAKENGKNS